MITYELVNITEEGLIYHYYPEDDRTASPGIILVDIVNKTVDMKRPAEKDVFRPASEEEKAAMGAAINKMREERGESPLSDDILAAMTKAAGKYEYLNPVMQEIAGELYGGNVLELKGGTIE